MADTKATNGTKERKAEIARLAAENERLKLEIELRAQVAALYEANRPSPGSERDEALRVAKELQETLDDCVHSIRSNDSDAGVSIEKVRRMRRALHRVTTDEDLAPTALVPLFREMRRIHQYFAKTGRADRVEMIRMLRAHAAQHLKDWSDRQLMTLLEAKNFNVAAAKAMTDHGYPMGPSNVDRLVQGRKTSAKARRSP